jgi:hypothetical protein
MASEFESSGLSFNDIVAAIPDVSEEETPSFDDIVAGIPEERLPSISQGTLQAEGDSSFFSNAIDLVFGETPDERRQKASNIMAISEVTGKRPYEVAADYDFVSKTVSQVENVQGAVDQYSKIFYENFTRGAKS